MLKRFSSAIMAICILLALSSSLLPAVFAAGDPADPSPLDTPQINDTVNATLFARDTSGNGYTWDNRYDTLTLEGLNIVTSKEYGMKVPAGATVVLNGENYIKASRAALALAGTVTFKGDGSLTLVSDDMGIYCYSTDLSSVIRFLSGTYTVSANGDGIYSTHSSLSFVDGRWSIYTQSPDAYAMNGTTLKLYGGKISAKGSVYASSLLDIQAVQLDITSEQAALMSNKSIKTRDVSISAGDSADSLAKAETYNGEACVSIKSTRSTAGESIFFGPNVPRIVDYITLLASLALIAAGIAVPFIRSRRKAKRALAAALAAEDEAEKARKAAKRESK